LLIGEESLYQSQLNSNSQIVYKTSYTLKKNKRDVMGWDVTQNGMEVICTKNLPKLIPGFWIKHVIDFLSNGQLPMEKKKTFLARPGGRKVLEAMEQSMDIDSIPLRYSYDILRDHGNMSSATVLYILKKWLEKSIQPESDIETALISALSPGFSSELLLVERDYR